MKTVYFKTAAEFRRWLAANHASERELLVGFYRKASGKPSISYKEAVDEALCFGWIDGVKKRVDEERYTHRFTPRKPDSIWSRVNMKRYAELEKAGRVTPTGRAAWGRRSEERSAVYTFERGHVPLDRARESALRANAKVWAFLEAQTPGYRKQCGSWVMAAKREETRASRFQTLMECCARGVAIPPLKWAKVKPVKPTHG